jgi:hypothetical protein
MGWPPGFNYVSGGFGNRRRLNSDGTISIICRICEKEISREAYRGFSTAICAVCNGELEKGKRPEDIIAQTVVAERDQAAELYNDLGMGGFKAKGLGVRIKDMVEKVRVAATRRRRSPLLSKKDKI